MATGMSVNLPLDAANVIQEIEAEHGLVQFPDHMRGLGIMGMNTIEVTMGKNGEQRPYARLLFVNGKPFTAKIRGRHAGPDYEELRAAMHAISGEYDFRL